MANNMCMGCVKPLTNDSNAKNIFSDELCSRTCSVNELGKNMKIYTGIEMITGQKVIKTNESPKNICEACLLKLEMCLNFRMQMLNSFNTLFKNSTNGQITPPLESKNKRSITKSSNIADNVNLTNINKDPQINVDDCTSSDDDLTEDEGIIPSMSEEQDNNNCNTPESPAINIHPSISPVDNYNKNMDNDIESDIDVCSGEDDEILELDVSDMNNQTIELDASSESDIDVCDYEPSGKRIKNYNALVIQL